MAQSDERFNQLKQKYQPAMNLMQQLAVRLSHVNMQGDKLFIQGEAPSQEVKNKVWDEIKLIDPGYSDLTCDITAASQAQPQGQQQTMTAGASVNGGEATRRYTVQPGDSLSKISKQFYGNPNDYHKIFEANRNVLSDPNVIRPGQELVIPE